MSRPGLPVGTRSSGALATVEPAGRVTPAGAAWSLDWWVGADDRWYVPAYETAARQGLVDQSPVIESRQRVPGGDIVHRVHAAQGSSRLDGQEAIVIELENETPVPVAVALVIRRDATAPEPSVTALESVDGRTIVLDEDWRLIVDREVSTLVVGAGGQDPRAVAMLPLPHRTSLRVVLVPGGASGELDMALDELPGADAVASGWAHQADHGVRIVLPDQQMGDAFTAARRRLLLGSPDLAEARWGTDQAVIARALAVLGHHDDLRPVVGSVLERQRLTGAIPDPAGSEAATGAALALLGWWWRHDPRPELLEEVVGPMAKAVDRVHRRRRHRRWRPDPGTNGLLPAGPQPVEVGGRTTAYLDDWWSVAGLLEASTVLRSAGQPEAADDVSGLAASLLDDVGRSVAAATPDADRREIPVGPDRPLGADVVGLLPALALLGVVDGTEGVAARTVDRIRAEHLGEHTWVRAGAAGSGPSAWLTACLALFELEHADRRGVDRLEWLVRAGGPVASWPRVEGRGDDPLTSAMFLLLVRALLVSERRPPGTAPAGELDILPVFPESWLGQAVEVHDAPTTFGRFGFALRWHGERPALLWELAAVSDAPAPRITCGGLAPGWSSSELAGETLLPSPVASTGASVMMGDDVSFS